MSHCPDASRSVSMVTKHTPTEQDFLDDLPSWKLMEFRNYAVNIPDASLKRRSTSSCLIRIEIEGAERPAPWAPNLSVKTELRSTSLPHKTLASVKIRTSYVGGREVLELSSDSEREDSDIQDMSGS
ncbi:hypothetical protein DFH07DRAFT_782869 [Mycena maculata]|uniref:Uncharacterized protein n=1 Tax=Mycena maculata TaxID=230809 RepID=A0AAD7HS33_9AGAR|nr:hypothetical protein DFH07DRAFT_782869 [Mycena maculata]